MVASCLPTESYAESALPACSHIHVFGGTAPESRRGLRLAFHSHRDSMSVPTPSLVVREEQLWHVRASWKQACRPVSVWIFILPWLFPWTAGTITHHVASSAKRQRECRVLLCQRGPAASFRILILALMEHLLSSRKKQAFVLIHTVELFQICLIPLVEPPFFFRRRAT